MSLPSKEPLAQVKMRKSLNMPTPPAFAALAAFDPAGLKQLGSAAFLRTVRAMLGPAADVERIEAWVRARWAEIGYEGYADWIAKVRPDGG